MYFPAVTLAATMTWLRESTDWVMRTVASGRSVSKVKTNTHGADGAAGPLEGGDVKLASVQSLHLGQGAHRHHHLRHTGGDDLHRQSRLDDGLGEQAQPCRQVGHVFQHGVERGPTLGHHHPFHPAAGHMQVGRQHAHPQF